MRRSICLAQSDALVLSTALTRNNARPSRRTVTRSSCALTELGIVIDITTKMVSKNTQIVRVCASLLKRFVITVLVLSLTIKLPSQTST
ncbi:hypothetical protein [Nostoc cycadae]|uniref:hypothetical protein n=1 Tax=Nostoc cycadae TaxID=246795 RepID=UPI001FEA018B|nr:hypothetical protein [Nostoc cycadae]